MQAAPLARRSAPRQLFGAQQQRGQQQRAGSRATQPRLLRVLAAASPAAPAAQAGAGAGSGAYDVVVVGAGISGLTTALVRSAVRGRDGAGAGPAGRPAPPFPEHVSKAGCAREPPRQGRQGAGGQGGAGQLAGEGEQGAEREQPPCCTARPAAGAQDGPRGRGVAGAGDRGPRPRGRQHHQRGQRGGGLPLGGGGRGHAALCYAVLSCARPLHALSLNPLNPSCPLPALPSVLCTGNRAACPQRQRVCTRFWPAACRAPTPSSPPTPSSRPRCALLFVTAGRRSRAQGLLHLD